jgi:hypothetical protein
LPLIAVYKSSDRFFVVFPSPRGWDYLQMEASSAPLQLKFGERFDDSPVACPTVLTLDTGYLKQLYCGKSAQGNFSCDDSKAAIKGQAWTFDLTLMAAGTIEAIFLKESAVSVKYVVLPVQEVGPGLVRGCRLKVEYNSEWRHLPVFGHSLYNVFARCQSVQSRSLSASF